MALAAPGIATAFDSTYLYDANHRLVGVLNSTGNSTRYVYDDLGNLVRTDSLAPSQFAILGFSPEHGAPGTPVSIFGQGFSTTAASNTVEFNGTVATVASSSANQLQVTVPAAATTGLLSVATGTSTASTATPFTVDGTGLAPVLTTVSPTIGMAGTLVTLTGTHLDPVAGETSVTLNGVPVILTTATDTTLQFNTPATFGGGKFLVTTPFGQATAAQDFVTQVPDYNSFYTVVPGRITVSGAPVAVTMPASGNKVTELLFDATGGDWLTLQAITPPTTTSTSIELYDPRGIRIGGTQFIGNSTPTAPLMQLSRPGTYMLVLWQNGATTFNLGLERDTVLAPNTPYAFATTTKGAGKRLVFLVGAGESFGVGLSSVTSSMAGYGISIDGGDQDGKFASSQLCEPSQTPKTCGYDFPAFVVDDAEASLSRPGWRQLLLTSERNTTSTASVQLVPDLVGAITSGGNNTIAFTKFGQNADQTFQATAGQYLTLRVGSLSTTPTGEQVDLAIYDPDGERVFKDSTSSAYTFNPPQLGKTGAYTLFVSPQEGATGNFTDSLLINAATVATVNGAVVPVSGSLEQQYVYASFNVTAGGSYTISCQTTSSYVDLAVLAPDGSTVDGSGYCSDTGSSDDHVASAPAAGTYTIRLYSDDTTFNATVKVTSP